LYDANGNVTGYVSSSVGQVTKQFEYDAFGNITYQNGGINIFRYRFSTKFQDTETGLYYYGRRFYDPAWGRWLNRDPIEEDGGLNLYGFCGNDGVNRWDMLGLWKEPADDDFYGNYLKGLYQNSRKVYRFERGDSLAGLARNAKLGIEDIAGWARFNPGHSTETTEYLVSSEGWRKFCYVSVPNVWIDADLLRGGGVYARVVNMGGSIGSFVGTDLLTSGSRKVVKVQTVTDLIQALQTNMSDIWGMTVYGHGGPDGTLSQRQQISNADWGESWINQRVLIDSVDKGGYKLAVVNMMQCYSGTSMGTYRGKYHDWGGDWRMHAIVFNYYEGLNVLGLDMGWKTWPWNWF
jgi:RHS repeat-associated protein